MRAFTLAYLLACTPAAADPAADEAPPPPDLVAAVEELADSAQRQQALIEAMCEQLEGCSPVAPVVADIGPDTAAPGPSPSPTP